MLLEHTIVDAARVKASSDQGLVHPSFRKGKIQANVQLQIAMSASEERPVSKRPSKRRWPPSAEPLECQFGALW